MGKAFPGQQTVLVQEWIPVEEAAICRRDRTLFRLGKPCPNCGADWSEPFLEFIRRLAGAGKPAC